MVARIHNENIALNQALWEFQNDKNIDVVIRRASRNGVTYWIYSDDREKTKEDVNTALSTNKAGRLSEKMTNDSSMPAIICTQKGNFKLTFIFKPKKGGMSQTTLNSSVTELYPCIAFMNGINPMGKTPVQFYTAVKAANQQYDKSQGGPYINDRDAIAGSEFVEKGDPHNNSMLTTKVKNAMNITRWLFFYNKRHPKVQAVYWGYRAKPPGVANNHPGDIFIKNANGALLGISLKAGGAKTDEPKLNTYVKPIFDYFGETKKYNAIKDKLWPQYMQIPGIDESDKSKWGNKDLAMKTYEFEKTHEKEYNELYDKNLEIIKSELISLFNSDSEKAKKYIAQNIAHLKLDPPLILIKATESVASRDKSGNLLTTNLSAAKKIQASLPTGGTKSKQAFQIRLYDGETLQLDFTTRTNKVGAMHKMGQFSNLAVKFNKVKKA